MAEADGATPLLEAKRLTKVYRTEEVQTRAVNEVDLLIYRREFVSIIGASGSGKSSLLGLLGLLEPPSSGSLWIEGREVSRLTDEEKARVRNRDIAFVFQSFHLAAHLTARENVELPLSFRDEVSARQAREQASEWLERVGLGQRLNHFPDQLSGGQKQRVAIARALACQPKLLFADEPTGNLDSRNAGEVMDLLFTLSEGAAAVLLVTHAPRFAALAQRRLWMADGRLAGEGEEGSEATDAPAQAAAGIRAAGVPGGLNGCV
jgi:putative ABC transport system ATP-binding protein